MKKAKIQFQQNGSGYGFTCEVETANIDTVVGTAVNRIGRLLNVCKSAGGRAPLKLNQPVDCIITVGRKTLRMGAVSEELGFKMRLGTNPKTLRRYGKQLHAALLWLTEDIAVTTWTEEERRLYGLATEAADAKAAEAAAAE